MDLVDVLTADLRHMTGTWDGSVVQVWRKALPRLLVGGRFRGLVWFRIAQRTPGTALALWLQQRCLRAAAADLHPSSRIGPGLCLVHSVGIVVGHQVVAGRDLVLYQNVTLGHGREGSGQPTIGDRVRIFAGAVVLGPIRIGDDAVIAANATVLADVPCGETVVGVWKGRLTGSH